VVAGSARRNHGNSGFCTDTVEAGEQLSQQRLRDGVLSLFSAKDPMDEDVGEFVRHGGVVPGGTLSESHREPGTYAPGFPISCLRH